MGGEELSREQRGVSRGSDRGRDLPPQKVAAFVFICVASGADSRTSQRGWPLWNPFNTHSVRNRNPHLPGPWARAGQGATYLRASGLGCTLSAPAWQLSSGP